MKFVRRAWPAVLLVLLVAAGGVFWVRHNEILDWAAARGYEPTTEIRQMVSDTSMTPYAERLFFANRPVVEDKDAFNRHCTDPSEQVAVLGCFVGNRQGIYLFNVQEKRLKGIKQVTAAHEMLHQAFQRLDKREKSRIGGLLQEYHDLTANKRLKDKIASYKQDQPENLQNEMHSIFATEAEDLPAELEEYYKQYFADRQKVIAQHHKYQAEFDERIAKINDYDERLSKVKSRIEANKDELEVREAQLRQQRARMDAYLAANQVEAYNVMVPGFNASVVSYRSLIDQTNDQVDEFNRLLAARNELAVQERQLENAIDSSVNPAASQ
jgi:hypothetical protein